MQRHRRPPPCEGIPGCRGTHGSCHPGDLLPLPLVLLPLLLDLLPLLLVLLPLLLVVLPLPLVLLPPFLRPGHTSPVSTLGIPNRSRGGRCKGVRQPGGWGGADGARGKRAVGGMGQGG